MTTAKTDIIIPTYRPGKKLVKLLEMLKKQTYPIGKIILINTEKKYFEEFFDGTEILKQYDNLVVKHISAFEFDHGATRDYAVSLSKEKYFVCMTDDAIPVDEFMLENLMKPLQNGEASVSYGRQCVGKKGDLVERYTRQFNYPKKSLKKTKEDLNALGIKTFFCSNVCAAYDRAVYDELGGFEKHIIFNEDMVFASKVIMAGKAIYYAAEAKVKHYHKYSNWKQLQRNFDLGVSQANYPEVFEAVSSTSEGVKLVKKTTAFLWKNGKVWRIPGMWLTSGCKFVGFQLGKHYRMLPEKWIASLTMNPNYWRKK